MDRDLGKKLGLNGPEGSFAGPGADKFDAFTRAWDELDHFITMEFKATGPLLKRWHEAREFVFLIDCQMRSDYVDEATARQG